MPPDPKKPEAIMPEKQPPRYKTIETPGRTTPAPKAKP